MACISDFMKKKISVCSWKMDFPGAHMLKVTSSTALNKEDQQIYLFLFVEFAHRIGSTFQNFWGMSRLCMERCEWSSTLEIKYMLIKTSIFLIKGDCSHQIGGILMGPEFSSVDAQQRG